MLNWATRYYPILRVLRQHLDRSNSLLEVGTGPVGIGKYLRRPFIGCDVKFDWGPESPMVPAIASAGALPFGDKSFDMVVLSDVLEHVPTEKRIDVVREALRVTREIAVFGFPSGPEALQYDRRLAGDYDCARQKRPVWLDEHLEYPFPTEDLFQDLPAEWAVSNFGNESVAFHYWTMRLEMHRLWVYLFMILLAMLPRTIESLLRRTDREPYYRKIVVVRHLMNR